MTLKRIDNFARELWFPFYILIMVIFMYIMKHIVVNLLFFTVGHKVLEGVSRYSDGLNVLTTSVISPFLETLIFQTFIFKILSSVDREFIKVLVSAFLFALAHAVISKYYFIFTITGGFLYAYTFLIYKDKHPTLVVTLLHGLSNLLAINLGVLILQ